MLKDMLRLWPLFLGIFIIGLVAGSQGSLLGIRSANEGFSDNWIAVVMTTYFVGFLLGSVIAPILVRRVGHVRSFAALTALASMSILIHPMLVSPLLWAGMRLVSGFAVSSIIVIIEAWLNRASNDKNRGQALSLYMVIFTAGLVSGQFILNLGDPNSYELFTLISLLVSFAAVPLLLSTAPAPPIELFKSIKIRTLLRWAPYGVAGLFLVNILFGVIMGMGAVYTTQSGLSVFETSLFMAALLLGNALLQWPLGKLSDIFDRRKVICCIACVGCLCAFIASMTQPDTAIGLTMAALVGGFCLPLYALFIALTNDYMKDDKVLPASGTLVLIGGFGTVLGPLMASFAMQYWGKDSYFFLVAAVMAIIASYGAYRTMFHPYVPKEDRHEFSIYAPSTAGANLRLHDSTDEPASKEN